jgi:hypothetical protein
MKFPLLLVNFLIVFFITVIVNFLNITNQQNPLPDKNACKTLGPKSPSENAFGKFIPAFPEGELRFCSAVQFDRKVFQKILLPK